MLVREFLFESCHKLVKLSLVVCLMLKSNEALLLNEERKLSLHRRGLAKIVIIECLKREELIAREVGLDFVKLSWGIKLLMPLFFTDDGVMIKFLDNAQVHDHVSKIFEAFVVKMRQLLLDCLMLSLEYGIVFERDVSERLKEEVVIVFECQSKKI